MTQVILKSHDKKSKKKNKTIKRIDVRFMKGT